jgi:hypothetical protein
MAELRARYAAADSRGRVRLLKSFRRDPLKNRLDDPDLPRALALLAVQDPDPEVRRWMARHGRLDYDDNCDDDDKQAGGSPRAGSNLIAQIMADPDRLVRAALRENPGWHPAESWEDEFARCQPLERLALVRHAHVGYGLIQKIFDLSNDELPRLDIETRTQLARAFLTNQIALATAERTAELHRYGEDYYPLGDLLSKQEAREFLTRLWTFASLWPKDSGIPDQVYRHVGVPDKVKAKIYTTCPNEWLRYSILMSCSDTRDDWDKTIDLGLHDPSGLCRSWAHSLVSHVSDEMLASLLRGTDTDALSGLARNKHLSTSAQKQVAARLKEFPADDGAWWTGFDLEQKLARHKLEGPPEDAEGLFEDPFLPKGRFLEEKIDVIGKTVMSLGTMVVTRLSKLDDWRERLMQEVESLWRWGRWVLLALVALQLIRWVFGRLVH